MPVVPPQPADPAQFSGVPAEQTHSGPARADAALPDLVATLAQAKAGNNDAWRAIVGHYGPRLFALVYSRCRDRSQAEEVVQGVLASVAVHVCQGRYDEQGKFEPWLFRVAMNRVRDLARSKSRAARLLGATAGSEQVEQVADHTVPSRSGEPTPQILALREALQGLSAQDREVIELRHHAGLSFQAMADVLEEPLGTLLARHHRALHKLRTLLGKTAIGEGDWRSAQ